MYKKIEKREEYFISFTDEEAAELKLKQNQKFDWVSHEDGSIELKPWTTIDLGEISEFPREVLELLVLESLQHDISINEVVNKLLKQTLLD
jgi:hypothetical protein